MTIARKIKRNNIVVGAGEIRLAAVLADDTYDGERNMGDVVGMNIAISSTTQDVQSGSGANPIDLETITTETDRTLTMTLHDINTDNLAIFFQGVTDQQVDTVTEVIDEALVVNRDRWYQLGQSADTPLGIGAASDVVIASSADGNQNQPGTPVVKQYKGTNTTTDDPNYAATDLKDATVDVIVDLKRAAIYITPDAPNISDGDTIYVDYTPVAKTRPRIKSSSKSFIGAVHYIEQSQDGVKGHDIYARRCRITASGDMAAIGRDREQQIGLSCKVLAPTDGYPSLTGIESMGPDSYDGLSY